MQRPDEWPLSLLLLASAACHSPLVESPTAATLELSPIDADVWSSELNVTGRILGPFDARHCELQLLDSRFVVSIQKAQFRYRTQLAAGNNRIRARCFDAQGRVLEAAPVTYVNRTPNRVDDARVTIDGAPPNWLEDAVLYGVYPPLYGSPPLRSVTRALTSLAELGINGLWLAPVMKTLDGNFGYAITDHFALRDDYGNESDLVELVNRAHELNMRVLLDFVPNHTSDQHPYFVQAQQFRERSHYFDFYERAPNGESKHYFDWNDLPNLNYAHLEVRTFITAAGRKWLDEFGADGFRVDAAWGVAKRRPDFYTEWTRRMSSSGRHAVLIAEASAREPFFIAHGFDAAYDWTNELGQWAWQAAFESTQNIATGLRQALSETARSAGRSDRVLRFINNNDTGARFVTRHGLGLTKAATVALLTLPGVPCLYSFDEVGAQFEPYSRPKPIDEQPYPELRSFHRRLIALRHTVPALRGPGLEVFSTSNQSMLVYARRPKSAQAKPVLVAINFSNTSQSVAVPRLEVLGSRGARELFAADNVIVSTQPFVLSLSAFGFAILEPR